MLSRLSPSPTHLPQRAAQFACAVLIGGWALTSHVSVPDLTQGPQLGVRPAHATIVEKIAAVVGEQAILFTDVRERSRPFLVRIYSEVPPGPQRAAAISQVYEAVLDRMIDEELEDIAAARAGIVVTAQEVERALERVADQNEMTPQAILAEAKRSGLGVKQYREELRRQVLQAKLTQLRLQGRVRIDEGDVTAAYRRLARDERMAQPQRTLRLAIPLGSSEAEQQSQLAKIESLAERARQGESFKDLVRAHATAPGSGLAAPAPPAKEPAAIQRVTMALEVGEISRPIKVDGTWMIIQVLERPPSQLPPLAEVREQLRDRVYMEKMARARETWLEGLRRRTHVEVRM